MEKLLESNNSTLNNVLIVLPGDIEYRGIQVFFYNVIKKMDHNKVSIDMYFGGACIREEILKFLSANNIGVFVGKLNFHNNNHYKQYRRDLNVIFCNKEYQCIHINSGIPKFNAVALDVAKKNKINTRIVHSHSAHILQKSYIKRLYKLILQFKINYNATNWIACSKEAGNWMFGKRFMEKHGRILNNGIDVKKYIFSKEKREQMRVKYDMRDNHIILHVGAFNRAKNQSFLVEVFEVICKFDKMAKLIMIGTGEYKDIIKEKVSLLGLERDVLFIDETSSVEDYMQMADLFILPSFFEGLGFVNIEAQASGMHCLVSDIVPEEAKITELVEFISLEKEAQYWAQCAIKYLNGYERKDMEEYIIKNNYDISTTAKELQGIYCR